MGFTNYDVVKKMTDLYGEIFEHDGFGEMTVKVNILKRGQKEIIIYCGKQHRFVVDYPSSCNYRMIETSGKSKEVATATK